MKLDIWISECVEGRNEIIVEVIQVKVVRILFYKEGEKRERERRVKREKEKMGVKRG